MNKPVKIALIVAGLVFAVAFCGLAYFGVMSPETYVVAGNRVPSRFVEKLRTLELIDQGESIRYFYSDALFDIEDGVYFVTDKQLVLYSNEWDEPAYKIPFDSIAKVEVRYSDSWLIDSDVTVVTKDGLEIYFPLSSEKGGDKRFIEFLAARAPGAEKR